MVCSSDNITILTVVLINIKIANEQKCDVLKLSRIILTLLKCRLFHSCLRFRVESRILSIWILCRISSYFGHSVTMCITMSLTPQTSHIGLGYPYGGLSCVSDPHAVKSIDSSFLLRELLVHLIVDFLTVLGLMFCWFHNMLIHLLFVVSLMWKIKITIVQWKQKSGKVYVTAHLYYNVGSVYLVSFCQNLNLQCL